MLSVVFATECVMVRQLPAKPNFRIRNAFFLSACVLALSAVVAAPWDAGISKQFTHPSQRWDLPGDLEKAINLSEVFAHSFGAAAILGSILWLVPERRPALWTAALITLLSGSAGNGLKGCFVRIRPYAVDSIEVRQNPPPAPLKSDEIWTKSKVLSEKQANGQLRKELPSSAASGNGLPTQIIHRETKPKVEIVELSFFDSRKRSFPSGHAATGCGLAIGLSLVFRRGWWLFCAFAGMACVQRVVCGAHFPSDVLAGACLACLAAACVLCSRRLQETLLGSIDRQAMLENRNEGFAK